MGEGGSQRPSGGWRRAVPSPWLHGCTVLPMDFPPGTPPFPSTKLLCFILRQGFTKSLIAQAGLGTLLPQPCRVLGFQEGASTAALVRVPAVVVWEIWHPQHFTDITQLVSAAVPLWFCVNKQHTHNTALPPPVPSRLREAGKSSHYLSSSGCKTQAWMSGFLPRWPAQSGLEVLRSRGC